MGLSFYPQDTWGYVAALNIFCGEEDNEKIINALIENPGLILSEDTGEEAIREAADDEANDIRFSDWYSYGGPKDALKSLKELSALSGVDFGYWLCVERKHNDENYLLEKKENQSLVTCVNWENLDLDDWDCSKEWILKDFGGDDAYLGKRNTSNVYTFRLKNKKTGEVIYDNEIWVDSDGDSYELSLIDGMTISLDYFYENYPNMNAWVKENFEEIEKRIDIPEGLTADDIETSFITEPPYVIDGFLTGVLIWDGELRTYDKDISEFTIPEGVTKIGERAFSYCKSLASVTIPEGVTEIGSSAFEGCTSLASVSIPEGVTEIGGYAFKGCTSIASVTIPEGVTKIDMEAFNGCTSLASVGIPASVTKIDYYAFNGCTSLASVSIPEGVTEIGARAFSRCTSLASVTIPASVTEIDSSAFDGCTALAEIRYGGTQTQWFMLNAFSDLPEDVTVHCSDGDFVNPKTATEYVIPEGVTKIGESAFKGCTSLTSVTIPTSVTEIGGHAFDGCTSLASVTIPEGVTEIGYNAFEGCTSLASVTIPESVTEIGGSAFSGCTALAEIHYAGTKDQWAAIEKGKNWNKDVPATEVHCTDGDAEFPLFSIVDGVLEGYFGLAPSFTIPEGVTEIGEGAFKDCTSLASVNIPEGVTKIGERAFSYCKSLASVSIPASVTEIGESAFYYCTSLASVNIPEGVTKIGESAFEGCMALASVTIPASVTEIGENAFYRCDSLASVSIPASVTEIGRHAFWFCMALASVTIPASVTEIGGGAFDSCTSLASVSIPEGVTAIGGSTFSRCTSLASVSIPEGVTEIGEYAFQGCTSLASVTIPASVTEIGDYAFYDCTALAEIHYAGTKEQWATVEKGEDWNEGVPATEVLVRKQ